MTIRTLPAAPAARPCVKVSAELLPLALERWQPEIQAAAADDRTISIFDPIGIDYWTGEGATAKRIAGALRGMGGEDVTVNINSPGGDMFEGLAMYNVLREYEGHVTIKVLGLAASAASIVAMAGDRIEIGRSAFFMIHNCWVLAQGNRLDLHAMADSLEPFDQAMADIYAAHTGQDIAAVQTLMDAETWLGGSAAIEAGLADGLLPSEQITESTQARGPQIAARRLDVVLARAGMPRSERRALIAEIKSGTPCAAGAGTPSAADSMAEQAALAEFQQALAALQSASSRIGA